MSASIYGAPGSSGIAPYVYTQTGIPQNYTEGLQNFGYMGVPFGGPEANYQSQLQFQQLMKSMLDRQLSSFSGVGNNINALPFNMRSMFSSAAPLLTDPYYSGLGSPGFLSNGWQMGALPNDPSWTYGAWKEQTSGYPNFPAPNINSVFGNPGNNLMPQSSNAGAQGPTGIGLLTPQQQNPNTGINQGPGGQYAAQRQQAADSGSHSATDAQGNTYTINSTYANMTDAQKDDANRYAHNMTG